MSLSDSHMLYLQWGAVLSASLAAAVCDVRTHRIPNLITLPLFVLGVIWATWAGGAFGLFESICAALVLAAPFVVLYVFAGGGAGDAKLMGAIGAWLGMIYGLVALTAVVVAGAVLGLSYALFRGQLIAVLGRVSKANDALITQVFFNKGKGLNEAGAAVRAEDEMIVMPYGISIFSGVCAAAVGAYLWHF